MTDHAQIQASLIAARDALEEYWAQGEGAACFIALRLANDALADYRALVASGATDPHIAEMAKEVERLRAPLDAMP